MNIHRKFYCVEEFECCI